jgi:transposase
MEDLSGIKESTGFPMILAHWTYFDLQTKIEYKAKEHGIQVKKIKPRYTSQRCSKCGCIDRANRPEQAKFKCVKCGFEANADYNAAQNLSIKDIDSIISAELEMAKNA